MMKLLCSLVAIFLISAVIAYAQPFGPPLYIADPVNMKCKYYFAGDQRHFNPRPENYTINVAYTTDFKSETQACEFFRCAYTNGTVKVDENKKPIEKGLCVCQEGSYWNNETGCVKIKKLEEKQEKGGFFSRIWHRWKRNFCES